MPARPAVGSTIDYGPIPIDEDETTFVSCGVLELGVASRLVDRKAVERLFADGRTEGGAAARRDEIEAQLQATADDPPGGVAIHVRDATSKQEYLRFDCFDDGPHYHYIEEPGRRQTIVKHDVVANGPALEWALERLRRRLPEMLGRVGRRDIAALVEQEQVDRAVDLVGQIAAGIDGERVTSPVSTA